MSITYQVKIPAFLVFVVTIYGLQNRDWGLVKDVSHAFSREFHCGCIGVMFPSDAPPEETMSLFKLGVDLGRVDGSQPTGQQLTAVTYDDVMKYDNLRGDQRLCYNALHIVVYSNSTKHNLISLSQSYRFKNSIWLIFFDSLNNKGVLEDMRLLLDCKIFIATRLSPDKVLLEEVFKVGPGFRTRVQPIGSWTRQSGLSIREFRRGKNLEGLLFRAGTLENWPLSTLHNCEADGYLIKVWSDLGSILNFTTNYVISVDGTSGRRHDDGEWTGLTGMILNAEIDVIVSEYSMSQNRMMVTESLLPILTASMEIYYRVDDHIWDWTVVFQPFGRYVWVSLLIWLVLAAMGLSFSSWIAEKHGLIKAETSNSSIQPVFFVFQTVCQQGSYIVPDIWCGRIIFFCCYVTSSFLLICYSASLLCSITHRLPIKPYDSIQDLLDAKFPIFLGDSMVEYELFQTATDPLIKRALLELVQPVSGRTELEAYAIAYQKMCDGKGAMFGADSTVDSIFEDIVKNCNPNSFSKSIMDISKTIALAKGSPYREVLNCNILRLRESGILNKHFTFYLNFDQRVIETEYQEVQFGDIAEIFVFHSIVVVISVIILMIEKTIYSWN